MSPVSPPVGADVESICGKCGDVWHVVVAKVGDRIAKVQCKQCGAPHRYSPPAAVREREKAARQSARESRAPKAAKSSEPRSTRAARNSGPLVALDPLRAARPYAPADTYQVGDVLQHPTFGRGVVELLPMPGKIQVFFPDGRRVLVAGKTEIKLLRPRSATPDDNGG